MKKSTKVAIFTMVLLLLPLFLYGQKRPMKGRMYWSPENSYVRMYNPETVVTMTVVVLEVKNFTPKPGMMVGLHLIAKSGKDSINVHLGPAWYLKNQELNIEKGDKLTITGSLITYNNEEVYIAQRVEKDLYILMLRNQAGVPYWAGWRKATTSL